MKTLLWLAAGGVGLYILDQMGYFAQASATPVVTSPQANTSVSVSGGSTSQTTTSPAQGNSGTLNQIIALMKSDNQDPTVNNYSAYVYGTYYNILKGVNNAAPDPNVVWPGYSANPIAMPISTWWTGVSGQPGIGMIAHHVNPYMQGPRPYGVNRVYGANLAPLGPETMIVKRSVN